MKLTFSILRTDGQPPKEYSWDGERITFGRAPECGVVLDNDIVSGQHAYIEPFGDGYRLCDQDSTNGTKLNGAPVTGSVYIHADSVIEFGDGGPQLKVVAMEASPAVVPVPSGDTEAEADSPETDVPTEVVTDPHSSITYLPWLLASGLVVAIVLTFALWPRNPDSDGTIAATSVTDSLNRAEEPSNEDSTTANSDRDSPPDATGNHAANSPAKDQNQKERSGTLSDAPGRQHAQANGKAVDKPVQRTQADILATAKARLVWIGIRTGEGQRQSVVPLASGWCLSNSEIVTAADAVAPLAGNEQRAVVYSELLTDNSYLPVQEITFPQPYTAKDTTFAIRQQNNVARVILADSLPIPGDATPGPLTEAEWRHAVSKNSGLQLLRCGYEIPNDEQRVSPVDMPKITSSIIHVSGAAAGSSDKHLPVMKCVGQPSTKSITGQLIVQQDGRPLGTAVQLSSTEFQLVPADRLEHYKFAEAEKHEVADLEDELSLEERRQQLRERLQKIRELRDWAFQRFDEPTRGATRIDNFSEKVTKARTIRRDALSHLINLPPSENTKDIWSGKGMNALLDHLGPVALQHAERLQGVSGESLSDAADPDKLKYLADLANGLRVPRMHLMNIQCQQGMTGQPLKVELAFGREINQQVLLLDWPAWFRLHDEFHAPLKRIEAARNACIKSAGSGDYSAAKELQRAIDGIEQKFASASRTHYRSLGGNIPEGKKGGKNMETREIYRANSFLKTLRYSVGRFIEMDHFPDNDQYLIQVQDYDHPNGIPVVVLLAAMQERGLRFAEATRSSELSRGFIFERMRDYYVELFSLYAAVQDAESQAILVGKSHSLNWLDRFWSWVGGHDVSLSLFDNKLV